MEKHEIDYDKLAEAIQEDIQYQIKEWRKERLEELYANRDTGH